VRLRTISTIQRRPRFPKPRDKSRRRDQPGVVTRLTIGTRHFFVVTSENPDAESGISSEVSAIVSAEFIAVGDSITFGANDDIPADGIGYEPILASHLATTVANEGVAASPRRRAVFISATLSKYPSANYFLVLYGTNDAIRSLGGRPRAARGCSPGTRGTADPTRTICRGSSRPSRRWEDAVPAKVPFTPLPRYSDTIIQEYNAAIDELVAANGIPVTPPDLYLHFKNNPGNSMPTGCTPTGQGINPLRTCGRPPCARARETLRRPPGDNINISIILLLGNGEYREASGKGGGWHEW